MRAILLVFQLAWPLAKRDITARYRGSVGGLLWTLIGPLAMVAIYAAVFQGVFQARWPGVSSADSGGVHYALRLFAGLLIFSGFSELATRATRLLQENASLVKRVVFPLELLCVSLVMQVAVHMAVQVGMLTLLIGVMGEGFGLHTLWLLLIFPWIMLLLVAVALALSSLGCYLRDLHHLVPLAMSALLFLSPVFYPRDAAPEILKTLLHFNPMTGPIEALRAACFGLPMDVVSVLVQMLTSMALVFAALCLFRRLKPGFADLV